MKPKSRPADNPKRYAITYHNTMTLHQYRRMTVFALRMVRVSTVPRWQKKLRWLVREFLERIGPTVNGDYVYFLDWDNSERHPEDDGTAGFAWKHARPLLCDEVTRFIWDMEDEGHLPRMPAESDRRSAMAVNLTCCIRAAADIALAPSAGVWGWTAGQICAMWHGRKVPKWVTSFWTQDITTARPETPVWL